MAVAAFVLPGERDGRCGPLRLAEASRVNSFMCEVGEQTGAEWVASTTPQNALGTPSLESATAVFAGAPPGRATNRPAVFERCRAVVGNHVDQDFAEGQNRLVAAAQRTVHCLVDDPSESGAGLAADLVDVAYAFKLLQDRAELADAFDFNCRIQGHGCDHREWS